jgi:hypothetical protein
MAKRKTTTKKTGGNQKNTGDKKSKISKKEVPPKAKNASNKKSNVGVPEKNKRAPRKKVTLESHLEKYDTLIKFLDEEIDRKSNDKEKGVRVFRTIRKSVKELHKEVPKIANTKRKNNVNGGKVSGFVLLCKITDELADFMELPRGSTPSRSDITNAICAYARLKPDETRPQLLKWAHLNKDGKRNLQDPNEKMAIIPDEKLSSLLNYEQYKQDVADGKITKKATDKMTKERKTVIVDNDALYYYVIQILIQNQIVETLKKEKAEK